MKKSFLLLPLLTLMGLAACETVEGAGQDLSAAGSAISQESREAQSGM
ncbi:entericidin A/B family lipoprotein [Cereibacter sphaeroides]|nr:entericidin A/B family lipoprotein [Cereibacter sphaeroides]RHZ91625.1 entericidin, EcnA/B family [Cereibacter sphaeroides]